MTYPQGPELLRHRLKRSPYTSKQVLTLTSRPLGSTLTAVSDTPGIYPSTGVMPACQPFSCDNPRVYSPREDSPIPRTHDRGGWPTKEPIDRSEHQLEDWERITDALQYVLVGKGLTSTDELRRVMEDLPAKDYEGFSYY